MCNEVNVHLTYKFYLYRYLYLFTLHTCTSIYEQARVGLTGIGQLTNHLYGETIKALLKICDKLDLTISEQVLVYVYMCNT